MTNYGGYTDYFDVDVEGKIVFVSRGGDNTFAQKASTATRNGAVATIIYNNEPGTFTMDLSSYWGSAPCVSISQADAEMIKNSSTKSEEGDWYTGTLTVATGIDSVKYGSEYYTMSDFSSWGVPGSLELKPEITAPGGNIYSVNGAVEGGKSYGSMSGTSMAAPQAAGMAALLGQYIRENDLTTKTNKTERQLINSLLMSTAEPLTEKESGSYYSVLEQGAGLANIGNAINADSYIMMEENLSGTASDGKVKAELETTPTETAHIP